MISDLITLHLKYAHVIDPAVNDKIDLGLLNAIISDSENVNDFNKEEITADVVSLITGEIKL